MNARDRGKIDYSGFIPDSETDPEFIQLYTDALANESVEKLLESAPETAHTITAEFNGSTKYSKGDHIVSFDEDDTKSPSYTPMEFYAWGTFTADSVALELASLHNDQRHTTRITKQPRDDHYFAQGSSIGEMDILDEDDLSELSIRVAGVDPALVQMKVTPDSEYDGLSMVRPTFPLTLAKFWSEVALGNAGSTTDSQYLEIPLPTTQGSNPMFGRLLQEEIEQLHETTLRLTLAHATVFPELDAEQVTRLTLEYTWKNDKTQTTELGRYIVSDISKASSRLKIRQEFSDGKVEKLDARDPKYLQQFEILFNYMIELTNRG